MTKRELRRALPQIPMGVNSNRLAIARTLTGISLAELQSATGIRMATLSQIANGRIVPSADEQAKLARFFGVSVSALFPSATEKAA